MTNLTTFQAQLNEAAGYNGTGGIQNDLMVAMRIEQFKAALVRLKNSFQGDPPPSESCGNDGMST